MAYTINRGNQSKPSLCEPTVFCLGNIRDFFLYMQTATNRSANGPVPQIRGRCSLKESRNQKRLPKWTNQKVFNEGNVNQKVIVKHPLLGVPPKLNVINFRVD